MVKGPLHVQHDSELIPSKHKTDIIVMYMPELHVTEAEGLTQRKVGLQASRMWLTLPWLGVHQRACLRREKKARLGLNARAKNNIY